MSLFDKMFKKNKFDEKLDEAFDSFLENNPTMKKAKATISEVEEGITHSLEEQLYGKASDEPFVKESDEAMMRNWDSMIDQIIDKELGAYKICPDCGNAASAELDHCPKCGAQLPENTAAVQICPYCGAKNKALDFTCASCGKELDLIPEAGK